MGNDTEKAVIIDTEQYAGNFERDMIAYITGELGECNVGFDMAKQARRELPTATRQWFADNVVHVADEHGCVRPAAISATPGWYLGDNDREYRGDPEDKQRPEAYLSVEMVVEHWPSQATLQVIHERAKRFCADLYTQLNEFPTKPLTFAGIRCVSRRTVSATVKFEALCQRA